MLVEKLIGEEDGKTFSSNIKNRRVCELHALFIVSNTKKYHQLIDTNTNMY